jgi:hypothetical protein
VIIAMVYLFIVVFRTDPVLVTEAVLSSVFNARSQVAFVIYVPSPAPSTPWNKSASARRIFMKFVI